MASHDAEAPATVAGAANNDTQQASTPVEMHNLPTATEQEQSITHPVDQVAPSVSMAQPAEPTASPSTSAPATTSQPPSSTPAASAPAPVQMKRKASEALGPATDAAITPPASTGPVLSITLMLTTGARHPYKIDEKYLTNRGATAQNADGSFDPLQVSGYKLKELIWTDWRTEWEPRPATPSSIRLIIWGKMVDDKKMLSGTYTLGQSQRVQRPG